MSELATFPLLRSGLLPDASQSTTAPQAPADPLEDVVGSDVILLGRNGGRKGGREDRTAYDA